MRGQENCSASNLIWFTNTSKRCGHHALFQHCFVFPQCAGKVGFDQTWCDAIDTHIVGAVFDRQIACKLHIGGFANAVSTDHGGPTQTANRRHDDDGTSFALDHLRRDQVDQPVVGHDVVVQNFAKLLVSNASLRTVIGVARGVAHQHIDPAPMALGLSY